MKVHNSALKHGVRVEDAAQAADWPLWVEPFEEEPEPRRELRLGFDTQVRLLETVVLLCKSSDEMVIHAMPAGKQHWDLLPERSGHVAYRSAPGACNDGIRLWSLREPIRL